MLRKMMPAGLVAIALMAAPLPALAHGGGQGDEDCCKAGGDEACCEAEGKGKPGAKAEACEDCEEPGQGGKPMGYHGMHGHGHHGMMMPGMSWDHEIRYLPVLANMNQYVILGGGPNKRINDWFSMGWQNNLAIQTFNTQNAGFWFAPYMGVVPKLGYSVGGARIDVGSLIGFGGMARTINAGGVNDVLQARLLWALEPRVELTFQNQGWSWGLVGSYLETQYQPDLGGFTFGVKYGWGPMGKGGGKGGHGHDHHGGQPHPEHH